MKQLTKPSSSYHNRISKLIKENLLIRYEITNESHRNTYDKNLKIYVGKKQSIKVLRLYFRNNKSFFIREQYIEDYLKLISTISN